MKEMIRIKDQMNKTIRLEHPPKRIVSLVPSQTELLFHLGCEDKVVGITKFCIHPKEWFETKTRVGGTKNVNFETLKALQPDLVIANKEENSQADIERIQKEYPTYISDVFNKQDAYQMLKDVGEMVGEKEQVIEMVKDIKAQFNKLPKVSGKVLYFIWNNPHMVAGANTFIGHLIDSLGFTNAITDPSVRYQELTAKEIKALNADYLLLSSEPFPFADKHIAEYAGLSNAKVILVDGEMFSWYGSRMLKMPAYFQQLIDGLA